VSLNLKSPRGRSILTELLRDADVVIEGFSPETLKRLGFGWETLKQINPRLIYVQQSGLGEFGTYGRARAFGPTAQAFTGLSEMSGLPDPFPPAGIGYSYLDWFGAYNVANAVLAGLVRRESTGTGCHVDASQGEVGIYLTGTATLDKSANGGQWKRYGNRSPTTSVAARSISHAGEDRWIAVACFTEAEWRSLLKVLGDPSWGSDRRFATLDAREVHADELEKLINAETADRDGFTLMQQLQAARVPAGMCQTAEDRIDTDPQLRHRGWQVELEQQEIGVWPVKELPMRLSKTPSYIGGIYDRSGPSYGQDTSAVLQRVLGLSTQEISHLTEDGSL
jgi:crotonobetainyl-CoA:carnitine CoA-transferase CaiB-like acyl-CoA transferase